MRQKFSSTTRRIQASLFLLLAAAGTSAQNPSCPDAKPCSTQKPAASASQQFPYPGEAPDTKIPDKTPDAPAPTPPDSKSVKDRFPYPGEKPEDSTSPPAGSSSSSSSPSDPAPDPDAKPALNDEGTTGTTARQRRRLRPPAQKILSDEERVQEDLDVAHFYQQSGNLNGAYLRAKDAVKLQPQTPEAHLALAEIAEKLQKRDEAIAEYQTYLKLDPDGDQVKAARKNLEKLKP